MKKHALAAAALAAILFVPGFAHAYPKQGWYLGMGAGLGLQEDSDVSSAGVTDTLGFCPGYTLSGSVGFGFETQLRPEFEINYRRNNVDKTSGPGSSGHTGNFNELGFMGNLFYDFDTHTGLTPYIGVGLGGAITRAHDAGSVFTGDTVTGEP